MLDVLLTPDNAWLLHPTCENCIGLQEMTDGKQTSWRCYGWHPKGVEMKRDICSSEEPPSEAPMWCPKRIGRID